MTYTTPPSFVLVHCQPLLIGAISGCYCILNIRHLIRRQLELKELFSEYKNLNPSRYLRLLILAGADVLITMPLAAWVTAATAKTGIYPWISWEDTHYGFSRIDHFPAYFWRANPFGAATIEFTRWAPVVSALVFFAFFGLADEARIHYRSAIGKVVNLTSSIPPNTGFNGNMAEVPHSLHIRGDLDSTLETQKSTLSDSDIECGHISPLRSSSFEHGDKLRLSQGGDAEAPASSPPLPYEPPQRFHVSEEGGRISEV